MSTKLVLGIETSCDDTSIAIVRGNPEENDRPTELVAMQSFSQELIFSKWGGVVPEIAARSHLEKIPPLLENILETSKIKLADIDLVAVTSHPGLLGPLLTGINAAKTLCLFHKKPLFPVNHLYAHLQAIFLTKKVSYPYLGLLVSGGHTIYFLVKSTIDFEILGNTIDDASGEAFDKGGKILGLGYPAGKIIDDLAKTGDKNKYKFPVSLLNKDEADLSFSGVKTALLNFKNSNEYASSKIEDVAASYQEAIIWALLTKLKVAYKIALLKSKQSELPIVVGGGVACNSYLRSTIAAHFANSHFVEPKFCTDNGAMIANYALLNFDKKIEYPDCLSIDAKGQFVSKSEKLLKRRAPNE